MKNPCNTCRSESFDYEEEIEYECTCEKLREYKKWSESMNDIEKFIHNFKRYDEHGEVTKTFTEGYCYHFALILSNVFNYGRIFYDVIDCHFSYKYHGDKWAFDGEFYDITGRISPKNPILFPSGLFNYDEKLYERVMRDCVLKLEEE